MVAGSMGRPFTLAADPAGDKLQRWQRAIFDTFGAMDMRIREDARFSGTIRRVSFGDFELTDVRSSSECAHRTRGHLADQSREIVALLLITEGTVQLDQFRRRSVIGAGTFALLDLNEPFEWIHARPACVLGIKFSKSLLVERVGDLGRHYGRMHGTTAGIGRLTADFLESFADQADAIDRSAGSRFERQFLDLTELLLAADPADRCLPAMTSGQAIYDRALAYIDRHLSDADLSPGDIARALPVSLRYLHAIFRSADASVGETILDRRLAACHRRLRADPRLRISDVAYAAGFRSHAHFSMAFKQRYGLSPRDFRRASPDGD